MREASAERKTADPSGEGTAIRSSRRSILAITLVALVLRVIVVAVVMKTQTPHWFFTRATELGCLAQSVLHGKGLASPFCGETGPSAFLAPGYPLLVTAVFRIFGPYSSYSMLVMLLLQAFFSTLTVPVAMWTARRAFGPIAARLTGILCSVNPWLIGLEAVFWETSLSILLLTALLGLALLLQRAPTRSRWLAAAITLAFAISVNPSLVLTGVALFGLAALTGPRYSRRLWVLPALVFLAFSSIWPARNLRMLHAFVPLRTNMGYELWQGNRPGADGFFQEQLHPNVNATEYGRYKQLGELGYMHEKSGLAKAWIQTHPARFAGLTLKRAGCFWLGIRPETSGLLILSTTFLTLGGVGSLLALSRRNRPVASFFALEMLLLPLPYYFTHPDFRFWCLLAPALTMLLAWWLSTRWAGPATA